MLNVKAVRKDFPILKRKINGKSLVYLDNAATTQKPRQVINSIKDFYENHNANIHRGIHTLSEEATQAYKLAHKKTARFINSDWHEVIFTRNTTESLNLIAHSLSKTVLKKGSRVLSTIMEHHSNIVPWQNIAGVKVDFAKIDTNGMIDMEDFSSLLKKRPELVCFTHASNVLGTINPVEELTRMAHEAGALVVIDGAQSAPQLPINMKSIDADFYAFSAHKMCGPTGIGVLYGKNGLLEKMPPFMYGGDMIKSVSLKESVWNDLPWKFEAGTPNICGGVAFGAAIDYLSSLGMNNVRSYEMGLTAYALKRLEEIRGVQIFGPGNSQDRGGVVSFSMRGIHPHDIASMLDNSGIAIRSGYHCAEPLVKSLSEPALARASFYIYNTKDEIDKLADSLEGVRRRFQ